MSDAITPYVEKIMKNIISKKELIISEAIRYKWPECIDVLQFCKNYLECNTLGGEIAPMELYSAKEIDLVLFYPPVINLGESTNPGDTIKVDLSYKIFTEPKGKAKHKTRIYRNV